MGAEYCGSLCASVGAVSTRARCEGSGLPDDGACMRNDQSALAKPAIDAANQAPNSELERMPGGHYEPFLDGHDHAVEMQLDFLNRRLNPILRRC
jgi:hypothetical protein